MDWTQILAILVPLFCAILTSPIVLERLQQIEMVKKNRLEEDVTRWVKIACSFAERWAENRRRANPDIAIASNEKLALARDVVRSSVPTPLDDREIEARIEHELVERAVRDVVLKIEAASGRGGPTIEKGAAVVP